MLKKIGEEWCVFDSSGKKKLGCHATEQAAKDQLAAIEAAKKDYAFQLEGVEIFAAGKHNGDTYTEQDLDDMVAAAKELDFEPAVKAGHDKRPGAPALGWVRNLRRDGTKLLADFMEMPEVVYNAIKDKLYNRVSAEVYWNFERAGKKFNKALKAVALLGEEVPGVANLKPLHTLFDAGELEVHYSAEQSIQKETEMAMTEEEIKQLVADTTTAAVNAALATFKQTTQDDEATRAAKLAESLSKLSSDEKASKIAELTMELSSKETKLAAEAKARETAEADAKAEKARVAELAEEARRTRMEKLVESCRIPALRPFVRQFADMASREAEVHVYDANGQKKLAMAELENFIAYANTNAARLFTIVSNEQGNHKNEANPAEEVDRRAKVYQSQHKDVTYQAAMHAVLDADPQLKAEYAAA